MCAVLRAYLTFAIPNQKNYEKNILFFNDRIGSNRMQYRRRKVAR